MEEARGLLGEEGTHALPAVLAPEEGVAQGERPSEGVVLGTVEAEVHGLLQELEGASRPRGQHPRPLQGAREGNNLFDSPRRRPYAY